MKTKLHFREMKSPFLIAKTIILLGCLIMFNLTDVFAQNENANENATVDGGVITTADNTTVCVGDGISDFIDVTLTGASGRVKQWIITDDENNIIYPLPENGPPFDFEGAGAGVCRIWHLSYNGIKPLGHKHVKNLSDLLGRYHLSNYIEVERQQKPTGGTLVGGPFEFCVGDGEDDHILDGDITLSGNSGTNTQWVVTDYEFTTILGLPGSYTGPNFEGAGAGICKVWHLTYEDGLQGLVMDGLIADLMGCFEFSNAIDVVRLQPEGGTLSRTDGSEDPFTFCVGDGEADHIAESTITLTGDSGEFSQWVVTDYEFTTILGLPGSYTGPNFEGAGGGICKVWHLSYDGEIQGLVKDALIADLEGCYEFSNAIEVIRNGVNGGEISRTDGSQDAFAFTVGDGVADNIPDGAITLEGNLGTNSKWLVTDDQGEKILGVADNYTDPDFDGFGAGTCLLWHISYEDGIVGLEVANEGEDANLVANISGCFSLSNSISVVRTASARRFALYPNPTKGLVNIDLSNFGSTDVSVKIYNLLNVQIFNRNFGFRTLSRSASTSIDISNYLEGIYFVSVTDNISGEIFIKRLIVK